MNFAPRIIKYVSKYRLKPFGLERKPRRESERDLFFYFRASEREGELELGLKVFIAMPVWTWDVMSPGHQKRVSPRKQPQTPNGAQWM